jgi:para-aminobenzoate synthetase component 1
LLAGVKRKIELPAGNALGQFQAFLNQDKTWVAGHLGFDLKNEIENLVSLHPDSIEFPDLFFFEPEYVISLTTGSISIYADMPEAVYQSVITRPEVSNVKKIKKNLQIQQRFDKSAYIEVVNQLQRHILRGDCYEINFCQEFYAENAMIDPVEIFLQLGAVSPNPFSALYRLEDKWLICASPERFLRREGSKIISQPIKGTSKRVNDNPEADLKNKQALRTSGKDQSENVMVVDIVRNDLAKICEQGTVKVDELFGIYSFPQVHQMISTISGELKKNISFEEIIRATFPMGSMTGAPKKRVMEFIEQYEKTKRGIFSGAVGYINPSGDFDFNVVIRSIMYNASNKYLSFQAGSGITWYSNPGKEWEECMLKAEAIRNVLCSEPGA